MDINRLISAVREAAALRRVQRLQPVGGEGDTIFPPTYPPDQGSPQQNRIPRHVYGRQRVASLSPEAGAGGPATVRTVLIDSVQSQANRLEEALLDAARDDDFPLPFVSVDFSDADLAPLTRITSLDAPHRVYDAILRDSHSDGTAFMDTESGRRLAAATPADATALFELSPNALLFGAWHSQGGGGGLGAKFPRAIVSEILGIDVPVEEPAPGDSSGRSEPQTTLRRTGSRIDPLGIRREVEVYQTPTREWDTTATAAGKRAKKVRPSEINHGNIAPTVMPLGVTCAYAEHRTVITFAGLRRLRFGSEARNEAARTMLAALGLVAITEQDSRGYALRSRCDLHCEGRAALEIVHADGRTDEVPLNRATARDLYREAYARAEAAGFEFRSLDLSPQEKLVEIIRKSRELALAGRGAEDDGE